MKRQPKMLLFLTTCLVVIFACKPTPRRVNHATHITPGMAHNLILQQQNNSSFKLIDVRTHDEFNVDHITGAINIDWNSQKDILLKLNKNDTLLLYCRSGRRSKLAMDYLKRNGFVDLFQMDGGLIEWQKQFDSLTPSPLNEK